MSLRVYLSILLCKKIDNISSGAIPRRVAWNMKNAADISNTKYNTPFHFPISACFISLTNRTYVSNRLHEFLVTLYLAKSTDYEVPHYAIVSILQLLPFSGPNIPLRFPFLNLCLSLGWKTIFHKKSQFLDKKQLNINCSEHSSNSIWTSS